jgi:DNA-binding response OmpR family regulator
VSDAFTEKKILIVDDDPDIVTAIRTAFGDSGAHLVEAGDGNTALELAEQDQPDLIVLDAMLPKRSGFLVLEKLKSKKPRGTKPYVIMITGNQGKRHHQWALSLGVDEYLNKPFRMERLISSAEKLLAKDSNGAG